MLQFSLRALVSNSFVSCLKYEALLFEWLKVWILVILFQHMEMQKGKWYENGLQGFHNLHYTMFQCMVCMESYKIQVFKNMQAIRLSILCPVDDINACHTFVWTVYDIHATIRPHIRLSICFLFFIWWLTRENTNCCYKIGIYYHVH